MGLGSLVLDPIFNKNTTEYTTSTTNASDTVTAECEDATATLELKVNGSEIESGDEAVWEKGKNVVTAHVTDEQEGQIAEKTYTVNVTKTLPVAKLTALTIGSLTLDPTFDADTFEYATTTSNTTNKITATAEDGYEVTILNGETEVESGESATWEDGENTVTITVTKDGYEDGVYTVIVTKE